MSEQWIEFFPKRQLFGNFTQSTYDALDITGLKPRLIRVRAELFDSGDAVTVTIQEALSNEDSAYVSNAAGAISLTAAPAASLAQIGVQTLAVSSRFIRVDITTATPWMNGFANVQVEILVGT